MIYNFLLVLYSIFMIPKIFYQRLRKSKKTVSLIDRLGFSPPTIPTKKGRKIWIHAVSLGEMKATAPLLSRLYDLDPSATFLITTMTATGFDEANKIFSNRALIRYLPLDFSWTMRRWVRSFHPDLLIFVEGDIWPNLLREAKKNGAKTAWVSGKISAKSAKRWASVRPVAHHLFNHFDLVCAQNENYQNRFRTFIDRPIEISGNLKLDSQPVKVDPEIIRNRFKIRLDQKVVTIASTHAPEERELLMLFQEIWKKIPDCLLFLAPRHPERFSEVSHLLTELQISYCRWEDSREQERVILVDVMGQLPSLYSISHLAIIGGSFSSGKGGHNVAEPCFYHCPVLFGPSMHAQEELARLVEEAHAGKMVTAEELVSTMEEWFQSSERNRVNTNRLIEQNRGSCDRTLQLLKKIL